VDLPDLTGEPLMGQQVAYTYTFEFNDGWDKDADPLLKGLNVTTTTNAQGQITPSVEITYHIDSEAPWLTKPDGWKKRRAPGEIQMALSDLIQAHASYKQGLTELEGLLGGIQAAVDILEAKHGVFAHQIQVQRSAADKITVYGSLSVSLQALEKLLTRIATEVERWVEVANEIAGTVKYTIAVGPVPPLGGTAIDNSAGIKAGIIFGTNLAGGALESVADIASVAALGMDLAIERTGLDRDITLFVDDARFEVQQMVKELETMEGDVRAKLQELYTLKEAIHQAAGQLQAVLAEGERLLVEREVFRKRAAGDVQDYRYQDMGFRVFRNDAVSKYRATFELAARYAYLAATAYDYETNLLGSETGSGRTFFTGIVRQRSPGPVIDGVPVVGKRGLADPLARLSQNFEVHRGQLGFNNPQIETNSRSAGSFSASRKALMRPGAPS